MVLSEETKKQLEEIYQRFLNDEKIKRMEEIPMHRGSNCYYHSFKVAKKAIKHALRHKKVNLEVVLVASILHDYYLYDWRKNRELLKHHGQNHPYIAAKNAERDFGIDEVIKRAIEEHMWPINIENFPHTKEARIVSVADKMVSSCEAMTSIKYKAKRKEKYLKYIQHLF